MILSKSDLEHDSSADVAALEDAHRNAVYQFIRSGLTVEDHIQEIECDASFDQNIERLYRQAFIDSNAILLSQAMRKFAEDWLDKYAEKKAEQVVRGEIERP